MHKHRELRGLTSTGQKFRGLRNKVSSSALLWRKRTPPGTQLEHRLTRRSDLRRATPPASSARPAAPSGSATTRRCSAATGRRSAFEWLPRGDEWLVVSAAACGCDLHVRFVAVFSCVCQAWRFSERENSWRRAVGRASVSQQPSFPQGAPWIRRVPCCTLMPSHLCCLSCCALHAASFAPRLLPRRRSGVPTSTPYFVGELPVGGGGTHSPLQLPTSSGSFSAALRQKTEARGRHQLLLLVLKAAGGRLPVSDVAAARARGENIKYNYAMHHDVVLPPLVFC